MPRHTQREPEEHLDVARRDVGEPAHEVVEQVLSQDDVVTRGQDLPDLSGVLGPGGA